MYKKIKFYRKKYSIKWTDLVTLKNKLTKL